MVGCAHAEVVRSLRRLNYTESLSEESTALVERLLADQLRTTENLKQTRLECCSLRKELEVAHAECAHSDDQLIGRHQHSDNQHQQSSAEECERRWADMQFVLSQYKQQLTDTQRRLHRVLQQRGEPHTVIHISGQRVASSSGIGSGCDDASMVGNTVDQSRVPCDHQQHTAAQPPTVQTLDLLSAAERRISVLEEELQQASQHQAHLERSMHNSLKLLEVRDAELDNLKASLAAATAVGGGVKAPPPSTAAACAGGERRRQQRRSASSAAGRRVSVSPLRRGGGGGGAAVTHCKLPYAELKKQCDRLGAQLKGAVNEQHEAKQRALQLSADNEQLRRQLQLAEAAVDEQRQQLRQELSEKSRECASVRRELDDVAAIAEALDCDRRRQLSCPTAQPCVVADIGCQTDEHSHDQQERQEQRHHVLEERLSQLLDKLSTADSRCQSATSISGGGGGRQRDSQQEEADRSPSAGSSARRCVELRQLYESQLSEAAELVERREADNCRLRRRLDEALRAIHRLSETQCSVPAGGSGSDNAAPLSSATTHSAVSQHTQSSTNTPEAPSTGGQSSCGAQCCRAVCERDDLRRRLKSATECQLLDRQRLETRLGELETLLQQAAHDKSLVQARLDHALAHADSLQTQVGNLQNNLKSCQTELNRASANRNKARGVADRSESALKSCEAELSKTAKSLENRERSCHELEMRCSQAAAVEQQLRRQLALQNDTVQQLLQQKDALQDQLDGHVEKTDERRLQLEQTHDQLHAQQSAVQQLHQQLDEMRQQLSQCERARADVVEELQVARAAATAAASERDTLVDTCGRQRSDTSSLTSQVQQLQQQLASAKQQHQQLQKQVTDYVSEVARVEQLLAERERERNDLLRQYRDLSLEANGLEQTNATLDSDLGVLRAELAAREKELEHSSDIISELNEQLQSASVARQLSDSSAQRLQESVSDGSDRLRQSTVECERLQRELNASRDLCARLDVDKQHNRQLLAEQHSHSLQLKEELASVRAALASTQQQLASQRSAGDELQQLVATERQRAATADDAARTRDQQQRAVTEQCGALERQILSYREQISELQQQLSDNQLQLASCQRRLTDEQFERRKLEQHLFALNRTPTRPPATAAEFRLTSGATYTAADINTRAGTAGGVSDPGLGGSVYSLSREMSPAASLGQAGIGEGSLRLPSTSNPAEYRR